MALTKNQLRLENDQNFPNNNTGFITAEGLRGFNDDMITSLGTQAELDSFDDRITANSESIEILSQSFLDYSSSLDDDFVSEVEFAAYTSSANADSASISNRVTELEDFSSSLDDTFVSETEFAAYTSSNDSRVDTLETSEAALNTYTGSNDSRVQSLETETGSLQSQIDALTTGSGIAVENDGTNIGTAFTLNFEGDSIEATYSGTTATITVDGLATTSSVDDLTEKTGSYATTGSNTFEGNQIVRGDLFVDGDLTARTLYIDSSSILYTSGSNKFGDSLDDVQEFTGSVTITGSFEAPLQDGYVWVGSAGSSTQIPSSSIQGVQFPYTGSAQITGSLGVTGSITIDNEGLTGSVIDNTTDTYASADKVEHVISLSQAEYDAIPSKDLNTLYLISGSDTGIVSASYAISASHADSADFATNSGTASYIQGTNVDGAVALADLATTSSYILGSNVDGSVTQSLNAISASYSVSSSHSERADVSDIADVASFVSGANVEGAVDLAFTASYVEGLVSASAVDFDLTTALANQERRLSWNDTDGTLDIGLKGGNVTLQIGQELVTRVVNKSGVDLLEANYQVVQILGAQGNRLSVELASADGIDAQTTLGVVTETILNNQEGFVTTNGLVREIDTRGPGLETWNDGDPLYLSDTTPGGLTNVKPTAPSQLVKVGFVINATVNGSIYVKIEVGTALTELYDVTITSASNLQTLVYDESLELWKNIDATDAVFPYTGSAIFSGSVEITGSFKASLQEGYAWVGDSNGIGQSVATSSFGVSGTSGIDGTSGINGTSGIDGTNGTNGIDGTNGTNGVNGINGTNGTSGNTTILAVEKDDVSVGDASTMNFTGSAVTVTDGGAGQINVEISAGGSGAGFPFIGDAQITGSLGVSGSISITTGSLEGVVVDNVGDTFTSVPSIDHIVTLTQTEYDGLTPDDNTLYVISGSTVSNDAFPYSGSAQITGSLGVTGSITIDTGIDTGSVVDNIGGNTIPSVEHIVSIDSASYAALGTYDENTLYVVSGSTSAATLSPYTGSIRGNITEVAEVAGDVALDFSLGNFFSSSIDGATNFVVSNIEPGQTVLLKVNTTQALAVATFSSNVLQPVGNEYTASVGINEVDILTFTSFDGTNTNLVAVNNLK